MPHQPTRASRSLANRVAIVTSTGSKENGIGNGHVAAILLAEIGCSVICVDMPLIDMERTVAMIKNKEYREVITLTSRCQQGGGV
jgi:hypothetical protein